MTTKEEIKKHWKEHEAQWSPDSEDGLGLQNVCIPGAPQVLNEYHDEIQGRVFYELLADVMGRTVLELGCGTGRWSRRLSNRGFEVTAIDWQGKAIEWDRKNIPGVEFIEGDIAEFHSEKKFDLILAVTVLQHLADLEKAVGVIKGHLKEYGYVLFLENISFRSETCFGREAIDWAKAFHREGFKWVNMIPYDHSFFIKLSELSRGLFPLRLAITLDLELDHFLRFMNLNWGARHAGFLFQKK